VFFNSQAYLLFFAVVFAVYWLLPWARARIWLLLAASYTFYAFWSQQLALLVAGTTMMDYLLARGMDVSSSRGMRRLLLGTSLSVNLGLLCYFKYANFFIDSLKTSLALAGMSSSIPYLEVVIPFGISFYTFEAISYTLDVYARRMGAERNLPNFMLFILFFPHLVAGPIVRARDFLRQAGRPKRFSWLRFQVGLEYFLIGLFKKMAIADSMAAYSDPMFGEGSDLSFADPLTVWIGVFSFAVRIYCDFSGYSDMALGSAHLLGYKLTINFRAPYLSKNIAEFWRRWHISLSNWLRDYIFIPLGGSRGSRLQTSRNLLITMLLGGLWHGANWSFMIWGGLHGLLLIIHRGFRDFVELRPRANAALQTWPGILLRIGLTFFAVSLCWVFFQPSLTKAIAIVQHLLLPAISLETPISRVRFALFIGLLGIGHLLTIRQIWKKFYFRLPAPVLGAGYALVFVASLALSPDTSKTFIYFQF